MSSKVSKGQTSFLSELNDSLANVPTSKRYSGVDNLLAGFASAPSLVPQMFSVGGSEALSFVTNGNWTTGSVFGIFQRSESNYDFVLFRGNTALFYFGRVAGSELTSLRSCSLTSVSIT